MRLPALLLWTALSCAAQFAELAATPDGTSVFFTTTLRERGSTQSDDPKLYRLDSALSLVRTQSCDPLRMTGACGITDTQATQNGIVYQSRVPCIGGSSCVFRETGSGTLIRESAVRTFTGRVRLSRNGRYLVNHDMNGMPGDFGKFARVHDLQTGAETNLPLRVKPVVGVSNTGAALSLLGLLVSGDTSTQLPIDGSAVTMDSQARRVLWQRDGRLFVTSVSSRQTWQITPGERNSFDGSLSDDGEWALHTSVIGSTPQLFFSRSDGSDWRQLTSSEEGVLDSALSGDGLTAYAVTGNNAIVRIDTRSGRSHEVSPPAPNITRQWGATVPGSLNILTGVGFAGAEVVIDRTPVPLLSASPTELAYQIPWDAPPDADITITGLNTHFEAHPNPVRSPQAHAVVHQDFASLVTGENPATPGEIVQIYATGLGPVDTNGCVTTDWSFTWEGGTPAEILYAGLAPGFTGIYQINTRMPSQRFAFLQVNGRDFTYIPSAAAIQSSATRTDSSVGP